MKISKGDAVTYVALVLSATLQALEPLRKEASVPPGTHPILSSSVWAYIPLALLVLVGCIWLYRQISPVFIDHPASGAPHNEAVNKEVDAPPPKPSLSPSEKDRLSNVIYELAQIIQKRGQPLWAQVIGISNQRRGLQLPTLKERLLSLQNDYINFRSELFSRFVPEHQYYAQDIMRLIGEQGTINGIDSNKAETLTSLADGHMVRAATNLNNWINGCDQRISIMRAALR